MSGPPSDLKHQLEASAANCVPSRGPTIGIFTLENGQRVAITLPYGAIVTKANAITGDVMVDVLWDERKVRIFEQDLMERGMVIDAGA